VRIRRVLDKEQGKGKSEPMYLLGLSWRTAVIGTECYLMLMRLLNPLLVGEGFEMPDWDLTTDAIVIGSGAAGLCGALTARSLQLEVLVVEKSEYIGGTSASSGGCIWAPCNPLMQAAGLPDSAEDALNYLSAVAGTPGAASSVERRRAFVTSAPRMVTLLKKLGIPLYRGDYPDYHSNLSGASERGRNFEVGFFDARRLGHWADKIPVNTYPGYGEIGSATEQATMLYFNKTLKGLITLVRVRSRTIAGRLRRKTMVSNGGAMIGHMLLAALKMGAQIWTGAPLQELVVEDGAVIGVVIRANGAEVRVGARHGVLLAAGGFSRNVEMRTRYGGDIAGSADWSMTNLADTGEVLQMAMDLGAATDLMDAAFWVPTMRFPDGSLPRYSPRHTKAFGRSRWRADSIIVDASGQRFADESMSYVELGQLMFARHRERTAVPSWLIFDDDFRRRCPFGMIPGRMPESWVSDGFVKRAASLDDLARQCGIDPHGLRSTAEKFSSYARIGVDGDFQRGDSVYDRFMADPPGRRPNRCLAPIERAPFYAVAIIPGDVGTLGGLVTDVHARVLDGGGEPIPGLYAAGTISAAVSGRGYLAVGGSLGDACTFGFLAMEDMARRALLAASSRDTN
jgi:3-oxosteroid 1-dehydrogenase